MMERRISATALARSLGDVLSQVRYRGDVYVVERHGTAVAQLSPVAVSRHPAADAPEPALASYFAAHQPSGLVAAYLFGSHARGTAHAESDLDVALLLDRRRHANRHARDRFALHLASELIAATHRNAIDVVVLNDAPPELAVAALDEGRRVYGTDAAAERSFARDARLRLADYRPFLDRTRRLKLEALSR